MANEVKKYEPYTIKALPHAVLSFEHVHAPRAYKGKGDAKYDAMFVIADRL